MERVLIFFALFLAPWPIASPRPSYWIIWNVGQGEWVTRVTAEACLHFDMGGEHWPRAKLRKICGDKRNAVYFSHWDMDHIGFAARARSVLPQLCLAAAPIGPSSDRKKQLLGGLPACSDDRVTIWNPETTVSRKKRSNELCRIYRADRMLIPGDAPSDEEQRFVASTGRESATRWLVLGHHGSRTSTSETLLDALPNLRLAIASARRAKYGHPHIEIVRRLAEHHVPLLLTEEWGDIAIVE